MRQTFSFLGCAALIGAALCTTSCGGSVYVDDDTDETAAGSPTGGTGTGSGTGSGTGTGSGSGTGSGTGTGNVPDEAAAVVASKCPNIAAEPHYCLTFGYPDTVWAVGPDTGNLCAIGTLAKEV